MWLSAIMLVVAGLVVCVGCPRSDISLTEHGNVCIDLAPEGNTVVFSSADGDLYLFDLGWLLSVISVLSVVVFGC